MTVNTILLTMRKSRAKQFVGLRPTALSSIAAIRASLTNVEADTLWISEDEDMTTKLLKSIEWPSRRLGRAVLLFKPKLEAVMALQECFDPMAFGSESSFLPDDELAEVLMAKNCRNLFIGGTVDNESETVTLWRGDLESLVVPFSAFPQSGDGISPDFSRFAVTDFGQTIQFGSYEAAADAILYEYDVIYRRQTSRARRESERSLGASIRRLRNQRGLRREDFAPLAAKTLARIEQGIVKSVRGKTLVTIAKTLGVQPGEIETY